MKRRRWFAILFVLAVPLQDLRAGRPFFFSGRRNAGNSHFATNHCVFRLSRTRSIKGQLLDLARLQQQAAIERSRSLREHTEQVQLAAALGIGYEPLTHTATFSLNPLPAVIGGYAPAGVPVPSSSLVNTVSGHYAQTYWPYVAQATGYPTSATGYPSWSPSTETGELMGAPDKENVNAEHTALELLRSRCMKCHGPGGTAYGEFAMFETSGEIVPGLSPGKIVGAALNLNGSRPKMPPEPETPLTSEEQEIIALWILKTLEE